MTRKDYLTKKAERIMDVARILASRARNLAENAGDIELADTNAWRELLRSLKVIDTEAESLCYRYAEIVGL